MFSAINIQQKSVFVNLDLQNKNSTPITLITPRGIIQATSNNLQNNRIFRNHLFTFSNIFFLTFPFIFLLDQIPHKQISVLLTPHYFHIHKYYLLQWEFEPPADGRFFKPFNSVLISIILIHH